MKILVACEFSGIVREAFAKKGHDAWSCDLLPSERPGQHLQCDAREVLEQNWDMIIAHPPCTYLSRAANHVWNAPGRQAKRAEALGLFLTMYYAPCAKVAVENPVGWPGQVFRAPDQIIHPFYFGESAMKRTCLWLRGLPKLKWTTEDTLFEQMTRIPPPEPIYVDKTARGKARHFTDAHHGGHERSKTFQSIADAMADQWG